MAKRKDECRFCGTKAHGYGCSYGEKGLHVEVGDSEHCIYCGSTSYGTGCTFSTEIRKIHKHGHGDHKCIWCGSTSRGHGCTWSPTGKHEF